MVKYEMLKNDTKVVDGVTVHRIVALKDFGDVKKGDLGGYIEYYTILVYTMIAGYMICRCLRVLHSRTVGYC